MRTRDTGILIVLLSGEGKSRADIELAEIQESGKSGFKINSGRSNEREVIIQCSEIVGGFHGVRYSEYVINYTKIPKYVQV